jgi:hopene-associated glycosyltransferase HpnB
MSKAARVISLLTVGVWVGLLVARGRFWDPPCDGLRPPSSDDETPDVQVVVPARDEAAMLPLSLPTLFAQDYPGRLRITLADDHSTDGTGALATALATMDGAQKRLHVIAVPDRPAGWAGKVWAMASAVKAVREHDETPAYWLFTDADIAHPPDAVSRLVATALADRRDLVSLMVQLRCESPWERFLIPAFVFFFAKLYPFAWVADDARATAGAAGGTMLVANGALERIGGLEAIAGALIDDCSLAAAIKGKGGRLRLELSTRSHSVRPYDSVEEIWTMVARSAYTQLGYSPLLLAGTIAGMLVMYAAPPALTIAGLLRRDAVTAIGGATAWGLMSFAYSRVLKHYGIGAENAPLLPLAGVAYTAMTLDSARRYYLGKGGAWKGRTISQPG